jgi:hypothetical protein
MSERRGITHVQNALPPARTDALIPFGLAHNALLIASGSAILRYACCEVDPYGSVLHHAKNLCNEKDCTCRPRYKRLIGQFVAASVGLKKTLGRDIVGLIAEQYMKI